MQVCPIIRIHPRTVFKGDKSLSRKEVALWMSPLFRIMYAEGSSDQETSEEDSSVSCCLLFSLLPGLSPLPTISSSLRTNRFVLSFFTYAGSWFERFLGDFHDCGYVRPRFTYPLASDISGQIEEVYVHEGEVCSGRRSDSPSLLGEVGRGASLSRECSHQG